MRLIFIFIFSSLLFSCSFAQEIIWADKIVDVSSEFSETEFSASQVLGSPNAMNISSKASNAWRPSDMSGETFITVSFDGGYKVSQIIVAESNHPGRIKRIIGIDSDFQEMVLVENVEESSALSSRYFHRFVNSKNFRVAAIRVEFDRGDTENLVEIDAIGIAIEDFHVIPSLKNQNTQFEDYSIEALGPNVNTKYAELNPILSLDGKILYFSRQKDPDNVGGVSDFEDIWFSTWDRELEEWMHAENIGAPLNNSGPNFISSISSVEGKEVVLLGNKYGKNGKMHAGVSMATKEEGLFSNPVSVKIDNDYNLSRKVDYFLSSDGTYLLISTERDDSFGKRDLYVSFQKTGLAEWSEPLNLGEIVNSTEEEESPFLMYDNKTLYFSSDGFKGFGGTDIYKTTRLDSTWVNWSVPENLGSKINGDGDDEYLSISPDEKNLYYTRSVKDGDLDIYDVNLNISKIIVSGLVVNELTNEPISQADVSISNSDGDVIILRSDSAGNFSQELLVNSRWVISTSKKGYEAVGFEVIQTDEVDLSLDNPLQLTQLSDIPLLRTGTDLTDKLDDMFNDDSLRLHMVFFDLNSSYLRQEAKPMLIELSTFLIEHVDMSIELSAHTDSRESQKYNLWMSERRAKRVRDFMIDFGVPSERITAKWYGEERLVNKCDDNTKCSELEHQKNRRTEIKMYKNHND